ncbi:MAG: hypothetical protein NTY66_04290 [Candidatus Vogelbacteria bacterium]|nr:hypothetical protein [Candidatus Vogelbacteria bacterium]
MPISYDEFQKMELKIGQIVAAERVEGSDKLLKMQVDMGPLPPRTSNEKDHASSETSQNAETGQESTQDL